jgi:DNA invertase Pin-like site-specific DNA recombinase
MRELDDLVTQFKKQKIRFSPLTQAIDTTTASGKLYSHIIAAFAEYEREGIRERTRAGVEAARARGRKGGRKHKLSPAQRAMVVNAYNTQTPIRDICHQFRISHTTIYRILKADKSEMLAAFSS